MCRLAAKQLITFTQKLTEVSAKEKDTMATFECETNEPFVKVRWLKNNVEIFSGDKYRMHSDRKVHFLSVLMISMKDEAEYSCVVIDDDVRTTGKLSVEGLYPNQRPVWPDESHHNIKLCYVVLKRTTKLTV